MKNKTSNWQIAIYFFTTLFLFIVQLYGPGMVLSCTAIIFILNTIKNKWKIKLTSDRFFSPYMLLFSGFCLLSTIWADSHSYALDMGIRMVEITIIMFVLYGCFSTELSINPLLKMIMFSGYAISIYVILFVGIRGIMTLVINSNRITIYQIDTLNANSIGSLAAYSILINFYFLLYVDKKIKLYDLLAIPGFLSLVASQSRKAFLICFLGILVLLILYNFHISKGKKAVFSIIKLFCILFITVFVLDKLLMLPMFNLIRERFISMFNGLLGGDSDISGRIRYLNIGLDVFRRNPIIGVGADNARLYNYSLTGYDVYLHNNYIELLANLGIIGFLLYYSVFVFVLYNLFKYRHFRDSEYDICLVLVLFRLIIDFGQITYYAKDNAFFLLMFVLEIRILENKKRTNK